MLTGKPENIMVTMCIPGTSETYVGCLVLNGIDIIDQAEIWPFYMNGLLKNIRIFGIIYFVVLFHSYDNAFIYSNASDWFFPDFVTIDGQGIHWILKEKLKRQG